MPLSKVLPHLGRLLTVGLLLTAALLLPAAAHAHVALQETSPAEADTVDDPPETFDMTFSGDVEAGRLEVDIYTLDGSEVPITGDVINADGNEASVRLPALENGTYVVTWSSVGPDGHLVAGQTYFSVGFAEGGHIADFRGDSSTDLLETAIRWVLYVALTVAVGLVWAASTGQVTQRDRLRQAGRITGAVLLLAVLARFVLVTAAVSQGATWGSGVVTILTAVPAVFGWLLLAAAAALIAVRPTGVAGWLAVVALAFGDGMAGHMGTDLNATVTVPLIAGHLLGAALWLGGPLAYLLLGDRSKAGAFQFARTFTGWAVAAAVLVVTSGVVLGAVRTGINTFGSLSELLTYQYGMVLTAKWVLLALVIVPLGAYHGGRVALWAMRRLQDRYQTASSVDTDEVVAEQPVAVSVDDSPAGQLPRRTLVAEAGGLLLAVALGAALGSMPAQPAPSEAVAGSDALPTPETYDECMEPGRPADQLICVEAYLEGVADEQGMDVAIDELTTRWEQGDSWMDANCHAIAHTLGRKGYRMFDSIPDAFAQGSDPCDYGYLHGVIEGASAGFTDQELRDSMEELCAGTGTIAAHSYRQCVHGVGHAAARRVNNDLERGMDFCDEYWREGIDPYGEEGGDGLVFNLCVTGVSMEWNTQRSALEARGLPVGADGTLMAECLTLDEKYHPGCIEYATSHLGGELEREIEARDWCDENLDDPLACYMSIGRDVIWSPHIDYETAVEVCTGGRGGKYEEHCLIRALGSVATIAMDADAVDDFCPYMPEEHQHHCEMVREGMRQQVEDSTRGFILDEHENVG